MAAAFLRALHPVVDDAPLVFDDPLAEAFLPQYLRRYLAGLDRVPRALRRIARQRRSAMGSMRAQIVVRSRWAEDALARARADDRAIRHLVLSAGLDTFAWRQPAPALPVVEVDHPATQRWKRRVLAQRGHPTPAALEFVSVDFEQQRLDEVLNGSSGPQFITWLGTSYYLTRSAITATLQGLAGLSAPGTRLALDYWAEAPLWGASSALLLGTRLATAAQREPLRTFMGPAELDGIARQCGWKVLEQIDAAGQNQRYLNDRSDDLRVPRFAHLALLER